MGLNDCVEFRTTISACNSGSSHAYYPRRPRPHIANVQAQNDICGMHISKSSLFSESEFTLALGGDIVLGRDNITTGIKSTFCIVHFIFLTLFFLNVNPRKSSVHGDFGINRHEKLFFSRSSVDASAAWEIPRPRSIQMKQHIHNHRIQVTVENK